MFTFTKNQTKFASVLISVALVTFGVSAGPAQAIDNRPACGPDLEGVTVCEGATTDGAKYAIQVPEDFNGTVFLYSHGYQYSVDVPPLGYSTATSLDNPAVGPDEMVNQTLLAQGYALAGSTFPVLGWNAAEAVKTNVELIGVVKKAFKDTKKVIAWGNSLGAYITQALAEKYPKLIDGTGLMCPALGDVNAVITGAGDFLWALKTFFEPRLTGHAYAAGSAGLMQAYTDLGLLQELGVKLQTAIGAELVTGTPQWPAGSPAATSLGTIPVRSVILYLGLMAGIPTRSAHLDGVTGPGVEGSSAEFGFASLGNPVLAVLQNGFDAAGLAVLAKYDLEVKSGGAFWNNLRTDYASRMTFEKSVFNTALSGSTAIAAIETYLASFQVPRQAASAPAAAAFAKQIKHTGKLSDPTVVLAATEDPITTDGNTQWLVNKQKTAAAKAKLLVLWNKPAASYTKFTAAGLPDTSGPKANGTGHCNFTADQYLAVSDLLSDAVNNKGKLDTGTLRANVLESAPGLSIAPYKGRIQKFYISR
jgi:alpha-beta hydrolase superfamily lysophospholipase